MGAIVDDVRTGFEKRGDISVVIQSSKRVSCCNFYPILDFTIF